MSEEYVDPSGNTTAFQAFAQRAEPVEQKRPPVALIVGIVAAVLVLAVVVWVIVS